MGLKRKGEVTAAAARTQLPADLAMAAVAYDEAGSWCFAIPPFAAAMALHAARRAEGKT